MSLTNVPSTVSDPQLRMFLEQVAIAIRTGKLGTGQALTRGDLGRLGAGSSGSGADPDSALEDSRPPATPTDLVAVGAFSHIILRWGNIHQIWVSYTEIWRADVDDLSLAVFVGTSNSRVYSDPVGLSATHFYWVRHISHINVAGPYSNMATASTADDPQVIADLLAGQISELQLTTDLTTRIDAIDTPGGILERLEDSESALVTNETDITALETIVNDPQTGVTATASGVSALDTRVTTAEGSITAHGEDITALRSTVEDPETGVTATAGAVSQLTTDVSVIDGEVSSVAESVTTLESTVGDHTSSISQIGTVTDGVSAQWMLKTDVDGYVAGYGLYNDGITSAMVFNVNDFAIGRPGESTGYPFIIGTVNGIQRIALNAATYIPDATITNAKIGTVAADKIFAATGTIAEALIGTGHIGNAMIGNVIQSNIFDSTTGWRLSKTGSLEASSVTIRNSSGQIILQSGMSPSEIYNSSQTYSNLGGTKPPIDADRTSANTAAGVANQGAFATMNQITDGTYIANAIVGTLHIGTNAVTVPASASGNSGINLSSGWQTIGTVTVNWGNYAPSAVTVIAFGNAQANTSASSSIALRAYSSIDGGQGDVGSSAVDGGQSVSLGTGWQFNGNTGSVTYGVQMLSTAGASHKAAGWTVTVLGTRR